MQSFQDVGQFVDSQIQQFNAWFATQPDEGRLTAALVIGVIVGGVAFMFARNILRVLVGIIRAPFAARTPAVVETSESAPPTPVVVPPDHWPKDVRYAVWSDGGSKREMVIVTEQFARDEKSKSGEWLLFNVSWVEAAAAMFSSGVFEGILSPPPILSRQAQDGENVPAPDVVFLFAQFIGTKTIFHCIAAEGELPNNVMQARARLIGNKMLRSTSVELLAMLSK